MTQAAVAAKELQTLLDLRATVASAEADLAAPLAPGAMPEAMYDHLAWSLLFAVSSSTKDRLARAHDGTVDSLSFVMAGLTLPETVSLATALAVSTKLTALDLGASGLSVPGTKALCAALRTNSALTVLRLADNPLADEGVAHVSGLLKHTGVSALTSVDLGGTSLGAPGAEWLARAVARSEVLGTLSLACNPLLDAGATGLLERLHPTTSLTSLSLSGCGLTDGAGEAVRVFLARNRSLARLDLAHNALSFLGVDAVAAGVVAHPGLTSLDLSANTFGPAGATALAAHLAGHRVCVAELRLAGAGMGDAGLAALLPVLLLGAVLLDVSSNALTVKSGRTLGKLLKLSSSIASLTARNNRLQDRGTLDVREALRVNRTLTTLDLTHNMMGSTGAAHLAFVLQANPTLKEWCVAREEVGVGA